MISKLVALLVAALFLAGVCIAADKKQLSDDLISDHVRLRLSADPEVKGGALDAACKDGVCTISGTVDTARQKDKAAKLAKKVKGVKQVVNNIAVKEKTGAK